MFTKNTVFNNNGNLVENLKVKIKTMFEKFPPNFPKSQIKA